MQGAGGCESSEKIQTTINTTRFAPSHLHAMVSNDDIRKRRTVESQRYELAKTLLMTMFHVARNVPGRYKQASTGSNLCTLLMAFEKEIAMQQSDAVVPNLQKPVSNIASARTFL
ncbi:predicted protein [Coccidioides posadasii str. Silveira]|uniref:Predicted protein n=1 Tax=Coccidioides posadasii (strain RMSCC 757 / Silveira) TaxID=443226 RepID=E9D8Y7_COCPS|nr:predicted protein [Coccidioides posadasii str. Silveira]